MKGISSPPVKLTNSPSGKLYLNSDQENVTKLSPELVHIDTIGTDFTDAIEDTGNSKITPGEAGLYLIVAHLNWKDVEADKSYCVYIDVSGSFISESYMNSAFVGSNLGNYACALVWLSAIDYIEMYAWHNGAGSTVDIRAGEDETYLFVQRMR